MTTPTATEDKAPPPAPAKKAAKKAAPAKDKRPVGRPSTESKLVEELTEKLSQAFGMIAMGASGGNLDAEGKPLPGSIARDFHIMSESANHIAAGVVKYSRHNKALRSWLEGVNQTGDLMDLIVGIGFGIALPIAMNHDLLSLPAKSPAVDAVQQSMADMYEATVAPPAPWAAAPPVDPMAGYVATPPGSGVGQMPPSQFAPAAGEPAQFIQPPAPPMTAQPPVYGQPAQPIYGQAPAH